MPSARRLHYRLGDGFTSGDSTKQALSAMRLDSL
jgi:hypothetical protein